MPASSAAKERLRRRLANKHKEEEQLAGPLDSCKAVKWPEYVSKLSGEELVFCLLGCLVGKQMDGQVDHERLESLAE